MVITNVFTTFFVFVCVLTVIRGEEECETYDGNGLCLPPCPDGTILYSADCKKPVMSRRSCRRPRSRSLGIRCDYTRCECEIPKVYDEAAKKCVLLKDCSNQCNVTDELYV